MRVDVDGLIYLLSFQHEPRWAPTRNERKHYPRHVVGRTFCRITKRDEQCQRHTRWQPEQLAMPCTCPELVTAQAFCSGKDQFNKETGRRESLKLALLNAFPDPAVRRVFWLTYFDRIPNPTGYKLMRGETENANA